MQNPIELVAKVKKGQGYLFRGAVVDRFFLLSQSVVNIINRRYKWQSGNSLESRAEHFKAFPASLRSVHPPGHKAFGVVSVHEGKVPFSVDRVHTTEWKRRTKLQAVLNSTEPLPYSHTDSKEASRKKSHKPHLFSVIHI